MIPTSGAPTSRPEPAAPDDPCSVAGDPDWRPTASLAVIRARADLLARVRGYFAAAAVMEVESPLLSQAAVTDPALASVETRLAGAEALGPLYLHTSPEFPMKRLLAAGSGPIYQICKVFRDDERGRLHHPEFSLLEWYRPGWNHHRLMDEVAALVRAVLERPRMAEERISYRDLFIERVKLDPWSSSTAELVSAAVDAGISDAAGLGLDRDGLLDLILTHRLESALGRGGMTFVYDYPPSQAALARLRAEDVEVAERFELYIDGVELANGFSELTNAAEQRRRFESDLAERQRSGLPRPPMDERFLAALAAGLPDSAGVALGLDRLLMVATGARHIDEVLAFPIERA